MHHQSRTGRSIAAGAVALALLAGNAWAGQPSSFAESRGYQACVDGAAREAKLIEVDSDYYIYEHSDARRYYLNGHAFQNGDSTEVKIACDTTHGGHRLLGVSVDSGQYAGRMVEPVEVAGN
jgi:ribosome modulation factor